MNPRLKNTLKYAFKGGCYFAVPSIFISTGALGVYYQVTFDHSKEAWLKRLVIENNCIWGTSGIDCKSDPNLVDDIYSEASYQAAVETENQLNIYWPAFTVPIMCLGVVCGAIYGFVQTPASATDTLPLLNKKIDASSHQSYFSSMFNFFCCTQNKRVVEKVATEEKEKTRNSNNHF